MPRVQHSYVPSPMNCVTLWSFIIQFGLQRHSWLRWIATAGGNLPAVESGYPRMINYVNSVLKHAPLGANKLRREGRPDHAATLKTEKWIHDSAIRRKGITLK